MNTEQQSPENFEISSPTILNDLRKCSSSYVSENPFLDTDPMTLVKQAWDLVSYQLANTHQKQPGEFHFRLFKCMQENQEKFGSPQISSSTKYDRLDKEMGDSELRLIRQRTQEFYDNNEDNDELIGYRSRALNQIEQMIKQNLTNDSASPNKKIDMSVIERIKSLRSQSREHDSESLSKRRDDIIREVQKNH